MKNVTCFLCFQSTFEDITLLKGTDAFPWLQNDPALKAT